MGFRNPFRIQVDENDVAYVTDYSPDSQRARARSAGRPARAASRSCASRPTTAGRCATRPTSVLPLELQHVARRWTDADAVRVRQPDARAAEHARAGTPAAARRRARPSTRRRSPSRTSGTRTATTPTRRSARRAWRTTTAPAAPARGSSRSCHGGVGPHGAAKYHYDPANPSTTKFPPYYDDAVVLRRVHARLRCARSGRRGQQGLQDQPASWTAARRCRDRAVQPFECDNPMDMQFGADGNFYLLTYGDGFFAANPDAGMYRWEYVKGQRAPQRRAQRRRRPTASRR